VIYVSLIPKIVRIFHVFIDCLHFFLLRSMYSHHLIILKTVTCFCFCVWATYVFPMLTHCQMNRWEIISPFCKLPLHYTDCFLCCTEAFLVWWNLSVFAFVSLASGVLYKKPLLAPMS
jgi:hypothetical protein